MGMLAGRVAVVTGAGQGIGRGIARALAREGMHTVVVDRDGSSADATVAQLAELGTDGISVVGDVERSDACGPRRRSRGLHASVASTRWSTAPRRCAPVFRSRSTPTPTSSLPFRPACGARSASCAPRSHHLRERGGSIVNIVSSAGTHGLPGFAGYAAAKEGIRGLTKVAANEWGPFEIRVNAISPQATSAAAETYFDAHPDRRAAKLALRPIKRDGDAEADIGRTVVFLLGPDSRYITGVTLMVNGGLTIMP